MPEEMNTDISLRSGERASPNWQVLYHAALFETDRHQIPLRIAEAEKAVLARIRELFFVSTDHIEEDLILDDALYALRALRNCVLREVGAA